MQRTGRKLRKTLKALTDPQPEFVSLVFGGANKSPFRAIRADGTVTGEGEDMSTEVTIKAETHEIARVEFSADKFADETAVKSWLADGGYSDDLVVTKTDGGFEVADPAITDTDLAVIDMTDVTGVKVYAVKQAEEEVLELTEKAEAEVHPGADETPANILALRACVENMDAPVLLDMTMALYNAVRSDLIADNVDGARAVITEYASLFDKLVDMTPEGEESMKDDMSMGDVANNLQNAAMGLKPKKSKPSVANDQQNTDDKIVADGSKDKVVANPKDAHASGKITPGKPGAPGASDSAASSDHNVDDKVKPNAPVKPGTKVNEQQNTGGKINPNGNMDSVANPNSAHGGEAAPAMAKGPLLPKKKAEFLAAIAPEIEVAKDETETAEKAGKKPVMMDDDKDMVTEEKAGDKKPTQDDNAEGAESDVGDEKKPGGTDSNTDKIPGKDMTDDQGDRKPGDGDAEDAADGGADDADENPDGTPKKKKKESDEAVEAVKSDDPLAQLTALVGTLATSIKAMQETVTKSQEEVVQRVAAMEDVRQTRKGADVDETGTASAPTAASENSRKMADLRTNSVLGRRRPLSD